MVGVNLAMLTFALYSYGLQVTFQQLTNLTIVLETLFLVISLKCSTDSEIKSKLNWLAVHHLTFEMLCPLNFLVFTVYWSVLRDSVLLTCDTPAKQIHTTVVHLLPMLFNLVAFYCTDIVIKPQHSTFLWQQLMIDPSQGSD